MFYFTPKWWKDLKLKYVLRMFRKCRHKSSALHCRKSSLLLQPHIKHSPSVFYRTRMSLQQRLSVSSRALCWCFQGFYAAVTSPLKKTENAFQFRLLDLKLVPSLPQCSFCRRGRGYRRVLQLLCCVTWPGRARRGGGLALSPGLDQARVRGSPRRPFPQCWRRLRGGTCVRAGT